MLMFLVIAFKASLGNSKWIPKNFPRGNNQLIVLLYSHILIHAHIYIYICWIHTDAMNNDERRLL